jgi:hypothetical protein
VTNQTFFQIKNASSNPGNQPKQSQVNQGDRINQQRAEGQKIF